MRVALGLASLVVVGSLCCSARADALGFPDLRLTPPALGAPLLARDDDQGPDSSRSSGDDSDSDQDARDWGVVAGKGVNGRAVHGQVGINGVRASYLYGPDNRTSSGGGLEIDFPPLSGSSSSGFSAGYSALRLIGNFDYGWDLAANASYFFHFDPQWILVFGNGSSTGFFYMPIYMPIEFGLGFELPGVHLGIDVGLPVLFGGSFIFPFSSLALLSPCFGAMAEIPLNDSLALTAKLRAQSYWFESSLFGTVTSQSSALQLFGLGEAMVGVAYRF